ncbi:MAG: putative nucleotidyltransferase substrate binding domain-containing protein [Actinomycetota bacterium]
MVGGVRRRIGSGDADPQAPDARLTPIGSLVRRAPVTADATTPVAEAAARMASERVSCLLVPMRGAWGIVTDRDLRTRVVATGAVPATPLEAIATFPVRTIAGDTLAGEALLAMFAQGVHHFPVADRNGDIVGVVTDTDLMGLGRHTPFAMKSLIERASTIDEVAAAGRDLPNLVVTMVRARADPIDVSRVVALVVDSMTQRLLDLAIEELGEAPCEWAWLALGSAARHEQALHTDQDHALVYDHAPGDVDAYFATMAERVTSGLEAAGIPRCTGDAMAVHPTLRRPLGEFVEQIATWMDRADPQAAVLSSVGYDFRQVAGPLHAEPALDAAMLKARARPAFVRQMARRALDLNPPTGFWHKLAVETKGEHAGRLDIKHGGITIVNNLARVWAVRAGAPQKDTIGRLAAASEAGQLDPAVATELTEAFHFLWDVRLHHQADQVQAGEPPDDFIDPASFGSFMRSGLKTAFRVIARAQRLLGSEESVNPRLP